MSRRVKIITQEKGSIEVLLIWSSKGVWESEWEPLRGTSWADLMTVVKSEVVEHALKGWSKPLMTAMGLPPEGALRKVPLESRVCKIRGECATHDPSKCKPVSKDLPWCYEPDGLESETLRTAAGRLLQAWREGVYVVVTHG